jgi:hypothetical protein
LPAHVGDAHALEPVGEGSDFAVETNNLFVERLAFLSPFTADHDPDGAAGLFGFATRRFQVAGPPFGCAGDNSGRDDHGRQRKRRSE